MGFHLPLIVAILSLAAVALANNAAQPAPQLYWNSVLPNTQMPRSISELLHPDSTNEEKSKPENIPLARSGYSRKRYGGGPPPSDEGKPESIPLRNSGYQRKNYGGRPPPSDEGKPESIPLRNSGYQRKNYGGRPPPSDEGKPESIPLRNSGYQRKNYGGRPPPSDEGKPESIPLRNSGYQRKNYGGRPPPSDEGKPESIPLRNSGYQRKNYGGRPPPSDEEKPESIPLRNSGYQRKNYGGRPPPSDEGKPESIPLRNSGYQRKNYGGRPPPSDEGKPESVPLRNSGYQRKNYGGRPPPSDSQLLHYRDLAIFFFEKDMRPGSTMQFQFPRNSNTATFLPRESAQSIPFSSNKLSEIFNHFSVKPTSVEAKTIKQTIEECEAPGLKGEEKYCATSLESMVDFSTSKLGTRNVEAISTEVLEEGATKYMHNYTTMPGLKKLAGDKVVVCHKENYPYAVFFCHAIKQTEAYVLTLKADDGMKVKAVTICHLDTSEWDPEHLSFQILNVKPGTTPICHFISTDAIAWVPNHKSA